MRAMVEQGSRDTGRQGGALSSIANTASTLLHRLLGAALLFVVGVNVVNASGRYLFGLSFLGADELMVYTVIWMVMAGAVLSLAMRRHISVNLLPSSASGRTLHLLHLIHDLAAVLACGYATYASYLFVTRIARLGTTSMGLGIPMTVPHAALLAGFGCLTLVALIMLARDVDGLLHNRPHAEVGA